MLFFYNNSGEQCNDKILLLFCGIKKVVEVNRIDEYRE